VAPESEGVRNERSPILEEVGSGNRTDPLVRLVGAYETAAAALPVAIALAVHGLRWRA
jgi:hypothetical protein